MKLMTAALTCSALLCSTAFASNKFYLETLPVKDGLSFSDTNMSHIHSGVRHDLPIDESSDGRGMNRRMSIDFNKVVIAGGNQ